MGWAGGATERFGAGVKGWPEAWGPISRSIPSPLIPVQLLELFIGSASRFRNRVVDVCRISGAEAEDLL